MMFISNLNYVAVAVVGGLRVAQGTLSLGDVQAFIQYSRQFTQRSPRRRPSPTCSSHRRSAERVFEVLDEAEEEAEPQRPVSLASTRVASRWRTSPSATCPTPPSSKASTWRYPP